MDTTGLNIGGCRFWIVMDYKGRDSYVGLAYNSVYQALRPQGMAALCGKALIRFKLGTGQFNFPGLKRKSKPTDSRAYVWVIGVYDNDTRVVCYRFKDINSVLKEKRMSEIGKAATKAFKKSDKTIAERIKASKEKKIDHIVFDTDKEGNIWQVKDEKKKQEILDPSLSNVMVTNKKIN